MSNLNVTTYKGVHAIECDRCKGEGKLNGGTMECNMCQGAGYVDEDRAMDLIDYHTKRLAKTDLNLGQRRKSEQQLDWSHKAVAAFEASRPTLVFPAPAPQSKIFNKITSAEEFISKMIGDSKLPTPITPNSGLLTIVQKLQAVGISLYYREDAAK